MRLLTMNSRGKTGWIGVFLLLAASNLVWAKSPHYMFILPDKYVGWIQIIFNDPQAPPFPLRKDKGYEIDMPESGISRTSHFRVEDANTKDEFYYRSPLPNGKVEIIPVPAEYVMTGDSHGGFGVMDTGGKGDGYSWFVFIGPPQLRAKIPLADWPKVVEEYAKAHGGNTRIQAPDTYPTPGRIPFADFK